MTKTLSSALKTLNNRDLIRFSYKNLNETEMMILAEELLRRMNKKLPYYWMPGLWGMVEKREELDFLREDLILETPLNSRQIRTVVSNLWKEQQEELRKRKDYLSEMLGMNILELTTYLGDTLIRCPVYPPEPFEIMDILADTWS